MYYRLHLISKYFAMFYSMDSLQLALLKYWENHQTNAFVILESITRCQNNCDTYTKSVISMHRILKSLRSQCSSRFRSSWDLSIKNNRDPRGIGAFCRIRTCITRLQGKRCCQRVIQIVTTFLQCWDFCID